jgi:hypothetical protein
LLLTDHCLLLPDIGRLTQRESAILTRWKSQVQILYRPPPNKINELEQATQE